MARTPFFFLDPKQESFQWWLDPFSEQKWREKYRNGEEKDIFATHERVTSAIMAGESQELQDSCLEAMQKALWIPAGRIHAGAGTNKKVTLLNCFVNATLDDSMTGIIEGIRNMMLTLQMGGGVGTDFSTLRPRRAQLGRLGDGAQASGPIPFMGWWDSGSLTVKTVGGRNGAMMGTISDSHPDLLHFVRAKQKKGVLEQFNISVLVSDAFMQAIEDDDEWALYFPVPPVDPPEFNTASNQIGDTIDVSTPETQYVYSVHRARDLWEEITRNTYEWSEPGVIFIDRINEDNNLQYCEEIRCTNPCGEQPLGPHDACDLGHYNLARMVRSPFTAKARFDWELLTAVVDIGQRFLDNVIDITDYPLPEQKAKHHQTRRTGGGFTGLASALCQLGMRYGSPDSVRMAERITQTIACQSYRTSIQLSKEKGPFPAFDADKYFSGFAGRMLDQEMIDAIKTHGIRNGVLNSVAPVGTVSVVYGDVESGCEPMFAIQYDRKARKSDNSNEWESFKRDTYSYRFYKHVVEDDTITPAQLPDYFVTVADLAVSDHIAIQAATQKWIDASVSKTINLPKEIPYDDFVQVYTSAYHSGCKGCTTFRPSEVRGSILSIAGESESGKPVPVQVAPGRPLLLAGVTYQIRWPSWSAALYITINARPDGRLHEIFFASKDARHQEWMTALTLMISAIFRMTDDPMFVAQELKQVSSVSDPAPVNGRFYPSLVSYIGHVLETHFKSVVQTNVNNLETGHALQREQNKPVTLEMPYVFSSGQLPQPAVGSQCPSCHMLTLFYAEGCVKCSNCDYSKC